MADITPNDAGIMADSDSRSIKNAIKAAEAGETRIVRIPRLNRRTGENLWIIDETILLPSDMTVLLDDCHLRMADGVFCNMFRNGTMYTPESLTPEGEQHDIHIIGRGRALLDGGVHNGLTEATEQKNGLPDVINNNLILLHNVNHYSLENFSCLDQRYWAINQIFCRNGRISDVRFDVEHYVRNQDGIDLRIGCSDIVIERISGKTGDDVVALTALPMGSEADFCVEGRRPDIHDVTIRSVHANTRSTLTALRCCDGAALYRIRIEDIRDTGSPWVPWGVVRLGENNYFKETPGAMHEITVRDVHSLRRGTVFAAGTLTDCHISGIFAAGDAMSCVSTYYPDAGYDAETHCHLAGGASMKNVVIDDLHYDAHAHEKDCGYMCNPELPCIGCAIDLRCMRPETDTLENVTVRNVMTNGAEKILIHPGYTLAIQ